MYCASWVRDIGPDLRPNDYKKNEWSEDKPDGADSINKQKEPSTLEDLGKKFLLYTVSQHYKIELPHHQIKYRCKRCTHGTAIKNCIIFFCYNERVH